MEKGDVIEIRLDMLPRIVKANEKVTDDRGRVRRRTRSDSLLCGMADNQCNIHTVLLNQRPQFKVIEKPDLLYGINQITTDAQSLSYDKNGKLATKDVKLTLIPYYAWAHRGEGDMEVWLPIDIGAASALPQKTRKWEDNGFFKN